MSLLVTLLLILTVALCLYVVIQVMSHGYVSFGGTMFFRVVTGSMEPEIPVGALIKTKEVPIEEIETGDIICFRTQASEIFGKIVTHRVVDIRQREDGTVLLMTKGDANLVADGYPVSSENLVGRVTWHTGDGNMFASIFSFFSNKIGFLACIVFPALLLAGLILKESVQNIRRELREAVEEKNQEPGEEPDPLCGMTEEEYQQMVDRIRRELIEELKNCGEISGQISEKE